MKYLERDAAQDFLDFCRVSYFEGVIGRYEFLSRMTVLAFLAEPATGPFRYAQKLVGHEGWSAECGWNGVPRGNESFSEQKLDGTRSQDFYDENSIFLFVSKAEMGFSKDWDFHKGDADPYPSVPHGHDHTDSRRKLHAYRGFIYLQGEPDGRQPRDAIIRLWNDVRFRAFAYEAIKHFVNNRPDWVWDRDPFVLPLLRRRH